MAEMLHGYFVADTQAEAEEFLKDYYARFGTPFDEFVGAYKGIWLWTAGQSKADVPWAFVVDDQGNLKGGFDCMLSADTRVVCVLAGRVTDGGKVDASGKADTTVSGVGSNSTPMTLTGQITDGRFTGELIGNRGKAIAVTATLE